MPPDLPERADAFSGDQDMEVLLRVVAILRESRLQQGHTLRDLTQKMGIAYSFLSRVERGLSQPGLIVLMRWCRALNLKFVNVWKQASGEE